METEIKKTLKEQIVGVWRSGDYFVSFSEDGYCAAYFPIDGDERIDDGVFTMDGDTVITDGSFYANTTKYIINSVSEKSINLTVVYDFSHTPTGIDDKKDAMATLTLTRTDEIPDRKINGMEGKTFTIDGSYISEDGTAYDFTQINTIHSSEKYHYIEYKLDFHGDAPEGVKQRNMYKYYIYLRPVIYTVTLVPYSSWNYEDYRRGLKVDKGVLTENTDGSLSYTPNE